MDVLIAESENFEYHEIYKDKIGRFLLSNRTFPFWHIPESLAERGFQKIEKRVF
jgi:hypothetical protein